MQKSKPMKLLWVIPIFLLPILIFLVVGSGDAGSILKGYNSLRPDKSNGISRQLTFLTNYTMTSGDLHLSEVVGIDEETMQQLMEDPLSVQEGLTSSPTMSAAVNVTSDDLRAAASAICSEYSNSIPGVTDIYHNHQGYNPITCGGTTVQPYGPPSFGTYYRVCNGLVSAVRSVALGQSSVSYLSVVDLGRRGTNLGDCTAVKASDVQVGDYFCMYNSANTNGHTEICVYKDSEYIYIANAGSSDAIRNTAANGYHAKIKLTDYCSARYNTSNFSSYHGYHVIRP